MDVFQNIMNKIIERKTIANDNNDDDYINNNKIKLENFHQITLITEDIDENKKEERNKTKKIAYIDGGNAEIIRSADISFFFLVLIYILSNKCYLMKIF